MPAPVKPTGARPKTRASMPAATPRTASTVSPRTAPATRTTSNISPRIAPATRTTSNISPRIAPATRPIRSRELHKTANLPFSKRSNPSPLKSVPPFAVGKKDSGSSAASKQSKGPTTLPTGPKQSGDQKKQMTVGTRSLSLTPIPVSSPPVAANVASQASATSKVDSHNSKDTSQPSYCSPESQRIAEETDLPPPIASQNEQEKKGTRVIIIKECQNRQCGTKVIHVPPKSVNEAVDEVYGHKVTIPKYIIKEGTYDSEGYMSSNSYYKGKRLLNDLINRDEVLLLEEAEEAKTLQEYEKDMSRQEVAQMCSDQFSYNKKADVLDLKTGKRAIHGNLSAKQLQKCLERISENSLEFSSFDDVYTVLREARPYIYKALHNLEERIAAEKTPNFYIDLIHKPVCSRDIAFQNYIKNKSVMKDLQSTKNCMLNAEALVANLSMLQTLSKNVILLEGCQSKEFVDLHRNLQQLEGNIKGVMRHIMSPDHIETIICAMGYVSDKSADYMLLNRNYINNFANVSGLEYNGLLHREKEMDQDLVPHRRLRALNKYRNTFYSKKKSVEERKFLQSEIIFCDGSL